MRRRFKDRTDAGMRLAELLAGYRDQPDTLVLGLARGGIPVAAAVATELNLPLGTVLVRKLGIPGHEETAFGALAWANGRTVRLLNTSLVRRILDNGSRQELLDAVEERERAELLRRVGLYPGTEHDVAGKTLLLVDDGLATGATMRAAIEAVRGGGAAAVVAAAPVASIEAAASVEEASDAVLCLHLPGRFGAVGSFYDRFEQLTDDDAIRFLRP